MLKLAKANLAEANLAALIESTQDLIWSLDLDYRLITFNRALQQNILNTYGVQLKAGMLFHEVLPPARKALWPVFYARVLAEGPFRVEYSRIDGGIMELAFNPIVIDGKATGISVFGKDITERKKSESALKEVEANRSALIESTEDLIWSIDLNDRLITFNRAFQQAFWVNLGIRVTPGMHREGLLPPDRAKLFPPLYERALAEGPFRAEYVLRDGRILELFFNPTFVEGKATGVSVFGKDITERKAAEEARRFFADVVESCEEAIITYAPSGVILTCNHGAESVYGYTASEAIGKPMSMFVAPERREMLKQVTGQLLGGAPSFHMQGMGLRKDGSKIHVTVSTWAIRNSAGEVTAICTIIRDVSARHEAEKNRALLASVVESSGDLIHAINLDGDIASWNQGAERMTGYTSEEILGKKIESLAPPGRKGEAQQYVRNVRDGCVIGPFDAVIQRKDGTEIDVSLTLSPIRNSDGEVVGASAVARDISQRKQAILALAESEARFRRFFEENDSVMFLLDPDTGEIIDANRAAAAYYGVARERLIGMFGPDINTAPRDVAALNRQRAMSGELKSIIYRIRLTTGELRDVEMHASPVEVEGKTLLYVILHDITERMQAEKQLRDNEGRYRTAFQTHFDAIIITRLDDGTLVDCNHAFLVMTGYERDEVIGRTTLELEIWVDPRDRKAMTKMLQQDSNFRGLEFQFSKKNGEICWGEMSASAMELDGVPCILSITRDLSSVKAAENTIRSLAFYDPLTGLPNRQHLMERLRQPLDAGARSSRTQALLLVDLDHFKTLNDTLGHRTGDLLLQEVARRIVACAREADTVFRMGGDEFVVLLEGLSKSVEEAAAQAEAEGEKILAAIDRPYLLEDHECLSKASIGIAVFGDRQNSTDEILQQAEIALYQAKAAGRNTLRFFSPALQAAVNARAAMEEDLRQGIKANQLLLYYQPQVERGRLTGAEALVRWKHPKRALVQPNDFIPLAEESRLILPLGAWVLEAACTQLALWASREETAKLTIAVNISALEFHQPAFVEQVLATLSRTGANPKNLRLELTESMLVEKLEDIVDKMTELKSHGLRFSLDDFGTGYSSLAYLKRLPLDLLKIDRSFVRDMLVDATSGAIAQTILSLGRAMGLSVIAEGVETEEQRGYLAALGCHSFQGFLFSRPLPLDKFEEFLQNFAEGGGPS